MKFEKIRELREDRDMKQSEMAELLRVRQSTYSKYELGKITVPIDVLIILADYYNISLDYLVGRSEYSHIITGEE